MAIFRNRFVKWVLAPVAVLWALGWVYFQYEYPTCTFRYKLTAEVMTPIGLKTGSSVVEVSYQRGGDFGGGPHAYDKLLGEATYVDLGGGKNLFVTLGTLDSGRKDEDTDHILFLGRILNEPTDYELLKSALDPIWLPIKIFKLGRTYGQEPEMCRRVSRFNDGATQPVELNNLPTLVTFSDMRQPPTAQAVNPNDLPATFGAGYALSAKIQITTENVTKNIEIVLPWVRTDHRQGMDQSGRIINRLAWWEFYNLSQPTELSYILH
jgi:hypothetical protein